MQQPRPLLDQPLLLAKTSAHSCPPSFPWQPSQLTHRVWGTLGVPPGSVLFSADLWGPDLKIWDP